MLNRAVINSLSFTVSNTAIRFILVALYVSRTSNGRVNTLQSTHVLKITVASVTD